MNTTISNEKAKIEEKITQPKANKKKTSEISRIPGISNQDFEIKIKEMTQELEEKQGFYLEKPRKSWQSIRKSASLRVKGTFLVEKMENIEKSQENSVFLNIEGFRGFSGRSRISWSL